MKGASLNLIFFCIAQVMIWPGGIWLMMFGAQASSPTDIGRAMATLILLSSLPLFMPTWHIKKGKS